MNYNGENLTDWLFIIDMTVELGARKCLVILGISQSRWQDLVKKTQGELSYQQMEVLAIEVMSQTNGEAIYQVLSHVTERVGVPLQIVSDHGSDLMHRHQIVSTSSGASAGDL